MLKNAMTISFWVEMNWTYMGPPNEDREKIERVQFDLRGVGSYGVIEVLYLYDLWTETVTLFSHIVRFHVLVM